MSGNWLGEFGSSRQRLRHLFSWAVVTLALSACALPPVGEMMGKAMETAGIKTPEKPDLSMLPFIVPLRIHAGDNLNAGNGKTPLGLLVRVYRLKDANAFLATPYESFLDPAREKEALGSDVLESREVLLVPGQRYEVTEKLPRESLYIGVVALFQAPAAQRWKLVFDAEKAQTSGIYIGALACALAVTKGTPVESPASGASSQCS